jgi:hypothetical protein
MPKITFERIKIISLMLFLFFLPWQTRWIFHEVTISGDASEYGKLAIYAIDILLMVYVSLVAWQTEKKAFSVLWKQPITRWVLFGSSLIVDWAFLSAIWAPETGVALMGAFHIFLAVAFMITILIDKQAHIGRILAAFILGMIAPAIFGWMQSAFQLIDASTLLGIAAQDPAVLGTAVIEHVNGRWLRAYGSFSHPNMFGGFSAVALVAAFHILAQKISSREQFVGWIAVTFLTGALIISASRTAWLAAILGMGLWTSGLFWLKDRARLNRLKFPVLISVLVLVVFGLSLYPILSSRFESSNRLEVQSVNDRRTQWIEAGNLLRSPKTWILGVGFHNEPFAVEKIKPLRKAWAYQPLHNVPGLILVELGLLGIAAILIVIVSSDWLVHKNWHRPSSLMAMSLGLTILVLALFDHYLWTQPSGLYLLAMFFALNTKLGRLSGKLDTNANI